MAFPVIEAVEQYNGASTASHTVTIPEALTGELLLMVVACADLAPSVTDWTQVFFEDNQNNGGLAVFAKVSDGTEGTSATLTLSSSNGIGATTYRISGWEGTIAGGVEYSAADATDGSLPDPPSLTPTWGADDILWFAASADRDTDAVFAAPTNYGSPTNGGILRSAGGTRVIHTVARELNASSEDPGCVFSILRYIPRQQF